VRTRPALHKAEAENFGLQELTPLLFVAKIYGNNFQGIGIVCNWASGRRLVNYNRKRPTPDTYDKAISWTK